MANEKQLNVRIQHKHDIETNWQKATNFIPKAGELVIYDADENFEFARAKVGDGVTLINDLPFVNQQKDWNQNNEKANDYIKNRTHWTGYGEIIPETTPVYNESIGYYLFESNADFIEGRSYTVNWNGVDYTTNCVLADGLLCLGNTAAVSGTGNTGEPFVIAYSIDALMYGAIPLDGSTEITFSIFGEIDHKIPDVYLPKKVMVEGSSGAVRTYSTAAEDDEYTMGEFSFAEGRRTKASGNYSHAEGYNTIASAPSSHAEGYFTTASHNHSHAEGQDTTASGYASHAEGRSATASGDDSHAEGSYTTASGNYSHAEGSNTIASSYGSHAEGQSTTASGFTSHAEGRSAIASGGYSHAEGYYTSALCKSQHTQGEYNILDPEYDADSQYKRGKYAHIVGNGTSEIARSNAHTLDWDGNAWFAGDIFVGGTSQDDGEKLAKVSDIPNSVLYTKQTLTDEQKAQARANIGITGTGADGYTPVRGTDYWTDADKAEIKSYVDEAILGGAW